MCIRDSDYLFRSWVEQGHDIFDSLQLYIKNNLPQTLGCKTQDISHVCPTVADFIRDAEYWWGKYKGMGVAKRVQAPPIFVVSSKAFGYGISECQNGVYYTQEYQLLKKQLLGEDVE